MLNKTVALSLVILPAPAFAQNLPPCAVGMHVDAAGGTNEPGTITDADEAQGSYKVRFDNSIQEYWMGSSGLKYSCMGAPAGARDQSFFFGQWDENHIKGGPDLVINSDGSYEWLVDADPVTVVRGSWREAEEAEKGTGNIGPRLVLLKGADDLDWLMQSQGDVDSDNREQILAEPLSGTDYYYFYRFKP